MSDQDAKDVADEAIEKTAEKAKDVARFIPLMTNLTTGMVALGAAVLTANLAIGKFKAAYEAGKKASA